MSERDAAMARQPLRVEPAPLQGASPHAGPLDLREVNLRDGRFAGADLRDADLRRADLRGADLAGARLGGARLNQADLSLADLSGADLSGADLSGADLSGADLREASLAGADVADSHLPWARLQGARGLPEVWQRLPRHAGRVAGPMTASGEPQAGIEAFRRGQRAHHEGQLGRAERHYHDALRWVPESDAARYGLGCVALERGDVGAARRWWRAALAVNPQADRARLELALLEPDLAAAAARLQPLIDRVDGLSAEVRAAVEAAAAAFTAGDRQAAAAAVAALLPAAPALRWLERHDGRPTPKPAPQEVPRPDDTIAQLGDEAWVEAERADIAATLAAGRGNGSAALPAWQLHSLIARSVTIGALDLATLAEQRLTRVAPEQRMWGAELRSLDLTAQAIEALARTRRAPVGAVKSVRWVALGAHGPTARVQCEGGLFFAKRWQGGVRPAASVAFTHRVCRALADAGMRVPLPLADGNGDDVMIFAGDLLALYPDIAGRSIREERIDAEEATLAGALLAEIHTKGERVAGGAGRPAGGLRNGTRLLRHSNPGAAWEAAVARDAKSAAWYEQHRARGRVESLLEATGRRLRGVLAGCRVTLTHGDFGAGNVLVGGPRGAAVLDWDLADVDLGVWDLARAIDRVAVHWSGVEGVPVEIRANIARALRRGYEAVRPLNPAERRALPVLVAASRVDLDATVLPLCAPLEPESAEPILRRGLQRLSRAAAGAPEVSAALWSSASPEAQT